MGDTGMSDAEVARRLTGLRVMEQLAEALEDRFDAAVREAVVARWDYPAQHLYDYLTGVGSGHEPRVRLLFELYERGALDLDGPLADVPRACFFLGHVARFHVPLEDWLRIFGEAHAHVPRRSDPPVEELWSAGDLVWGRSRRRAEDVAAYLGVVLDRPVPVWRARVPSKTLRFVAQDRWAEREAGRDAGRVVIPTRWLAAEQVSEGDPLPTDVPLVPRPRIVTEP